MFLTVDLPLIVSPLRLSFRDFSLVLDTPPAEAGGFFLQPEPPATAKAAAGLTRSPEAITASPAANTF